MTTTDTTAAEAAMTEKIRRLEKLVADLKTELEQTRAATLDVMLGPLRLRQAILLYIGTDDVSQFSECLHKEFSSEIANSVLRHLFVMNNAPLPAEQLESMRAVFKHGMYRW